MPILYLVFFVFVQKNHFKFLHLKGSRESQGNLYIFPWVIGVESKKINSDIYQNIQKILTVLKLLYKILSFQNLLQCIISNQPWPMEWSKLKSLENKTESNLTTPQILLHCLQSLDIISTGWMKTLTQTLTLSYHHILILLYKPNITLFQMPHQVHIMYHHLDWIKAWTIILIGIARIKMIHGHVVHVRKISFHTLLVI